MRFIQSYNWTSIQRTFKLVNNPHKHSYSYLKHIYSCPLQAMAMRKSSLRGLASTGSSKNHTSASISGSDANEGENVNNSTLHPLTKLAEWGVVETNTRGQKLLYSSSNTGSIGSRELIDDDKTMNAYALFDRLPIALKTMFLPINYPRSVHPSYTRHHFWLMLETCVAGAINCSVQQVSDPVILGIPHVIYVGNAWRLRGWWIAGYGWRYGSSSAMGTEGGNRGHWQGYIYQYVLPNI